MPLFPPIPVRNALLAALAFGAWASARAATGNVTWSGATGTGFETPANWVGNAIPISAAVGAVAIFSGTVTANQPVMSAARNLQGLDFTTATGGWTLDTATFQLTVFASGLSTIGQSSGTNTVGGSGSIRSSGGNWSVGTGGTLLVTAAFSEVNSAWSFGTAGTGEGTLILAGVTATGGASTPITLYGGTLLLGDSVDAAALGTSTTTVTVADAASGGAGAKIGAYGGARTVANAFTLNNALTVTGTNDFTFTGPLSGGGAFVQAGTGTTTLKTNTAFTGTVTVSSGTLAVANGNALGGVNGGAVTIASGATLLNSSGGIFTASNSITNNGTINAANRTFNLNANLLGSGRLTGTTGGGFKLLGLLSHGAAPGATTVDATTLTLATGSTLDWNLGALKDNGTGAAGTDWDVVSLLNAAGVAIQSGATLQIGLEGIAFDGSAAYWRTGHAYSLFSLADTSTVTGAGNFVLAGNSFSDAAGTGTFTVSGNNVVYTFTAAPEPGVWAFLVLTLALGGALPAARRRLAAAV